MRHTNKSPMRNYIKHYLHNTLYPYIPIIPHLFNYFSYSIFTPSSSKTNVNRYRRLALKYHPRKNPGEFAANTKKFNEICEAYEVLSQPQRKAIYDEFGEEVLKHGLPATLGEARLCYKYSGNANEIFEAFFGTTNPFFEVIDEGGHDLEGSLFGSAYGGADQKLPPLPVDVTVVCECTLEEFFCGCMKTVTYTKEILTADSKTTKRREFTKQIEIKPGYGKETTLKYPSEGNEAYTHPNANLFIKLKEKKHPHYKRQKNDLIFYYDIPLIDALCSVPIQIETLDKRELKIAMDEVISPQTIKEIKGEGMPIYSDDPLAALQKIKEKGNLYVKFNIKFPKFIPEEKKQVLKQIL